MDVRNSPRYAARLAFGRLRLVVTAAGTVVGIFLLIPIAVIFPMSFTSDTVLTWPPDLASLRWYRAFVDNRAWTDALRSSLRIGLPVAGLSTVIGTLAALGVVHSARRNRWLRTLFVAPLVLPLITYAVGLYDVSARLNLLGSRWPVVIGQTMLAMPLVFVVVSAGLSRSDPQLPRAAASLGARAREILWHVELPLVRTSIAMGALVALVYSFDEIIIAHFLLPPGGGTIPVQMLGATREGQDPTIAAAAVMVIGVGAAAGGLALVARILTARRS